MSLRTVHPVPISFVPPTFLQANRQRDSPILRMLLYIMIDGDDTLTRQLFDLRLSIRLPFDIVAQGSDGGGI